MKIIITVLTFIISTHTIANDKLPVKVGHFELEESSHFYDIILPITIFTTEESFNSSLIKRDLHQANKLFNNCGISLAPQVKYYSFNTPVDFYSITGSRTQDLGYQVYKDSIPVVYGNVPGSKTLGHSYTSDLFTWRGLDLVASKYTLSPGDRLFSPYMVFLKYFESDPITLAHELGHILFHSSHKLPQRKDRKLSKNPVLGKLNEMSFNPDNIMNSKSSTMLEDASVSNDQCERARIFLTNRSKIIDFFEDEFLLKKSKVIENELSIIIDDSNAEIINY